MLIVLKLEQPWNVALLILVTPLGIVILVKLEQLQNAPCPTLVTLDGMVNSSKLVHPLNA